MTFPIDVELIDAAEHTDGDVEKVLESSKDEIHPSCLDRALIAAVQKKNYRNVHLLLLKGASHYTMDQVLDTVEKGTTEYMHLILAKAAASNNVNMLADVYCPPLDDATPNRYWEWVKQENVSLELPIKIAVRRGNKEVWEKLMLMSRSEGSMHWSHFQLTALDENLLSKICDVKYLFLDHNKLNALPQSMVNLQQVST